VPVQLSVLISLSPLADGPGGDVFMKLLRAATLAMAIWWGALGVLVWLSGCGVNRVIVKDCQPVPHTDEHVCEKVRDL